MTRTRAALALIAGAVGLFVLAQGLALADAWTPLGRAAEGARLARMQASPQWSDGVFQNLQPMWNNSEGWFQNWRDRSPHAVADPPPDTLSVAPEIYQTPSSLRVSWFGHSSMLIEVDGARLLIDPIWGERAAPVNWAGPKRWYAPPLALSDLPPLDAVLISHDHYDHLDHPTIEALLPSGVPFVVPLGVGAHLEYWGVEPERILELDWWETLDIAGLTITATPARHASGRQVFDQMSTLWMGFAIHGPTHRVYYSGDTGYFDGLRTIGERLGPFDLTLIEVGAYNQAWPDWHIGPEQAIAAHQEVGGEVFVPVHWGMWNLSMHGWTEPAERVWAEAEAQGVSVYVPQPGEVFEPAPSLTPTRWWPELPWDSAEDRPIVSTPDGMPPG